MEEGQPEEPKTPPNVRETSLSQRKTRYSNNTNGLWYDNSEYCSYITASSNSNKKSSDIWSDNNKNTSNSNNLNSTSTDSYLNRRESYQDMQKSTIDTSMLNYNPIKSNIKFRDFKQMNNIPIVFNNNQNNKQNDSFQICTCFKFS